MTVIDNPVNEIEEEHNRIEEAVEEYPTLNITLNTGDGISLFQTPTLNGKLCGIVISATMQCSVAVRSSLGYVIFSDLQFIGTKYISPMATAYDENGHQRNYVAEPYYLDEPLILEVQGARNIDVTFSIRVD